MPVYMGPNKKWRAKVKEPITGSQRYLHPSAVGMEISSWRTKKEAKQAERELEKLVQQMYSPTTETILDLLTLCDKYIKSLPPTMNEETVKAKQHFCEEVLKK